MIGCRSPKVWVVREDRGLEYLLVTLFDESRFAVKQGGELAGLREEEVEGDLASMTSRENR